MAASCPESRLRRARLPAPTPCDTSRARLAERPRVSSPAASAAWHSTWRLRRSARADGDRPHRPAGCCRMQRQTQEESRAAQTCKRSSTRQGGFHCACSTKRNGLRCVPPGAPALHARRWPSRSFWRRRRPERGAASVRTSTAPAKIAKIVRLRKVAATSSFEALVSRGASTVPCLLTWAADGPASTRCYCVGCSRLQCSLEPAGSAPICP